MKAYHPKRDYGGSNSIGRAHGTGWSGWFVILITSSILVRGCYLKYNNFLCLSDKESALVRTVSQFHDSGI